MEKKALYYKLHSYCACKFKILNRLHSRVVGVCAMDGEAKIPAVKLFISQLSVAQQTLGTAGLVGLVLHSVEFTRVWLQASAT